MKKSFSLMLALVVCLSLSACASEKADSPATGSSAGNTTADSPAEGSTMTEVPKNPTEGSTTDEQGNSATGDLTVADKEGNIYTLSNPILYTISPSELEGVEERGTDTFFANVKEGASIIYAIPHDTVITAPDGIRFDCVLGAFIEEENGIPYCSEYSIGPGLGWKEFQLEEGWEGALFIFPCYTASEAEPDISIDFVDNIAFFVPLDETAGNPFAA